MKTKFKGILTLLLAFLVQITFAQEKTVSGTVSDASGALPGVSVFNKRTAKGTETDFDGKYTIKAKAGDILNFSYIGYKTINKTVGNSSSINTTLEEDASILDEVIVTAIGIKRKPKEMTSSVVSVKGEQLTKTRSVNAASSLTGKVSGLQLNVNNNGVNPSTKITLRGSRSILGNNEALIVIDGAISPRNAIDRINPDDIASMTVLKGSASAALYGSQAMNGVVVVTTKKGNGKLKVTYNTSLEFSEVAFLPELQEEFGAGGFPDGTLLPLENVNWGPAYDGRLVDASETLDNGDVWQVPYSPIKDRNKNFFNIGTSKRHGITLSGGDEKSDFYFSLDQVNTEGVVPKDKYNQTNVRFKASRTYNKLKIGANMSFFRSYSNTVGSGGRQGRPVYWNVLNTPLHLPLSEMKNWQTGEFTRNEVSFFRFYENPYFIIDTQREKNAERQFNFVADFEYKFNDWITASMRSNYTFTNSEFKREFGAFVYEFELQSTYSSLEPYGASTEDRLDNSYRFNNDLLLTFDKQITEDFSAKLVVGNNVFLREYRQLVIGGNDLIVPGFYDASTRTGEFTTATGTSGVRERRYAFYGDLTLGYKDYLFLNVTARNDWSSTLPEQNNSFFYPSAGLSFVASDAIPEIVSDKGLSYLKANVSLSKTGNAANPHVANDIFFAPTGFPYANATGLAITNNPSSPNLTPEFATSLEYGIEFGLLNNRITGSLNAYKTNTTDQITNINVSRASGALTNLVNIGETESSGIELDLAGTVIRTENFKWDVSANFSTFDSEVISLIDGLEQVSIGGVTGVNVIAKVGEQFPLLESTAYLRDDAGRVIVGDNGDPIQDSENQIQGRTSPNKILGLTTNFKYKNFSLYIVADYKTGHVFYNDLVNALEFTGLTQHSASSGRQAFVFPNSSYDNGSGTFIPNTDRLTTGGGNAFWDSYNEVKENYITDASAWKIREVSLKYDFDKSVLKNIGVSDLSLGLYGRNLFIFRPSDNVYTDPEFTASSSAANFSGIGTQSQSPPTRQFGVTLNVKF